MKIIEAFDQSEVRACGKMLRRVLDSGRTIEQFREFAATLEAQAANPMLRNYQLRFRIDDEKIESNEDVLIAIGLNNLRTFKRLVKVFERRGIDSKEIKDSMRRLRRIELEGTEFGRTKE